MSISSLKFRLGSQIQGSENQIQENRNPVQSFSNQTQTISASDGVVQVEKETAIPIYSPEPQEEEAPGQVKVVDTEVAVLKNNTVSFNATETNGAKADNTARFNVSETNSTETSSTASFNISETNSAVIPNSNYIALTTNAIDIINDNLKNQPLSHQLFDIIKAPTGGTTAFTIPDIGGDDIQKELVGVILDYDTPRAYWETAEPIEGTPPNCYSPDSRVSADGKYCIGCPYNEFGSKIGDSNAKACKEFINLYLLRPDSILPLIVRIPVTSKHHFQKYLTRLIGKMIPICGVVTKITLEKVTSKGGQPYAKFNFEAVEQLSTHETSYAKAYGQKFSDMLSVDYDINEVYDSYDTTEPLNSQGVNQVS